MTSPDSAPKTPQEAALEAACETAQATAESASQAPQTTGRLADRAVDMSAVQTPPVSGIARWLTSITRPVHKPLFFSAVMRIVNLTLDVALFALAAGGLTAIMLEDANPAPILIGLVAIAICKATAYYLEQFSGHYVAFKALELLRTTAFSKLWPKAPGVVSHSRSGDILASLTRDVDRIEVFYAHTFAPVVAAFIVPIIVLITVGVNVGGHIVWVTAICVALGLLVVPIIGMRSSFTATQGAIATRRDLTHHITDSVQGLEEVVGYQMAERRILEMGLIEDRVHALTKVPRRVVAIRRAANVGLVLISVISVVVLGIYHGDNIVVIAAVAGGFLRLFEGPRGIEDAVGYLDHSIASAKRLWQICHSPFPVHDGDQFFDESLSGPDVEWDHVNYQYCDAEGNPTGAGVRDVTVVAPGGKHTVIVGVSGSGKTTMIQLALRFDNPDSGQIRVGGVPVEDFQLDSLRTHMVLVSQKNQLLNDTIEGNMRIANPEISEETMWELLEVVDLADEIREMPDGLATRVGERGAQVSGGQAQRLCLARALALNPSVLVLDEFTANLNVELEHLIRANLAQRYPGLTLIEVTHRVQAAREADHVVFIDQGEVLEQGNPDDLASGDGPVAKLWARDLAS